MKKIVYILCIILLYFKSLASFGSVSSIVEKNNILTKTSTIAISITNVKSGKVEYEMNEKKLLHPASIQKIFTTAAAKEVLKDDYFFRTSIYKDNKNNLYLKLSADPFFSYCDLKSLIKQLKASGVKRINKLYIDDTIIDGINWGTGWMWDDELNSLLPKFSAYNMDGNIFSIDLIPNVNGEVQVNFDKSLSLSTITSNVKFIKSSDNSKESLKMYRINGDCADIINISGYINKEKRIKVPFSSEKRHFIYCLNKVLRDCFFDYYENIEIKKVPKEAKLVCHIEHNITSAWEEILKNSNNFFTETIFKVASSEKYGKTGSFELGKKMFYEYFNNKLKVNTNDICIEDASGVSRNNLLNANWVTQSLNRLYFDKEFNYVNILAQSNQGTMKNRLFDIKGNIWAKTGTLNNISSIAGYVKDKKGKIHSFCIITQNFIQDQNEVKMFENEIIREIYNARI